MISADVVLNIPNLFGWWRADSLALNDGNSVSSWADSSGNGHTAATGTAPVFHTNIAAINNKPVVDFTAASSQYLKGTGVVTDTYTMFAVGMFRSSNVDRTIFHNGNTGNGYALQIHNPSVAQRDMVYYGVADNTFGNYTNNTWEIWTGDRVPGTNGTGTFYLNGTSQGTTGNAIVAASALFSIGAAAQGTGNFMDGQIAEVIFYSGQCSAFQRAQVHTYLALKYLIKTSDMIPSERIGSRLRPHPFSPGLAR